MSFCDDAPHDDGTVLSLLRHCCLLYSLPGSSVRKQPQEPLRFYDDVVYIPDTRYTFFFCGEGSRQLF